MFKEGPWFFKMIPLKNGADFVPENDLEEDILGHYVVTCRRFTKDGYAARGSGYGRWTFSIYTESGADKMKQLLENHGCKIAAKNS
jgi:hypothetical protein